MAPRVRFLQKMQKQPNKELIVSQDKKVSEPRAPSLSNDEVEEFRAYFSEKMSILQKGGKKSEETEDGLANGISDEEEEEKESEEEVEEKLGKAKGYHSGPSTDESQKHKEAPMQFLDRDDDNEEEEDELGADFFKVKRHNVFGLDLKENKALQVSVLPMEGLLLFLNAYCVLLCCLWATMGKQELGRICRMIFFVLNSPSFSIYRDMYQRILTFL